MKTLFDRISPLIFLLSPAALLTAWKLTAAQTSDSAQREQEAKEANKEKKSNKGENSVSNRIHELLQRNLQEVLRRSMTLATSLIHKINN